MQRYPYAACGQNTTPLFINQRLVNGSVLGNNSAWQLPSLQQTSTKDVQTVYTDIAPSTERNYNADTYTFNTNQIAFNPNIASKQTDEANTSFSIASLLDFDKNNMNLASTSTNQAFALNNINKMTPKNTLNDNSITAASMNYFGNNESSEIKLQTDAMQSVSNKNSNTSLFIQSASQQFYSPYTNQTQIHKNDLENNITAAPIHLYNEQDMFNEQMQPSLSQLVDIQTLRSNNLKEATKKTESKSKQHKQPVVGTIIEECTSDTDTETDTDDELVKRFSFIIF